MRAVERRRRGQKHMERRAKPARRSSRLIYPKAAARGSTKADLSIKTKTLRTGNIGPGLTGGLAPICFGASPVASAFGSAPGSATPPDIESTLTPTPPAPSKQDISTLLGIGHFYFALTCGLLYPQPSRRGRRLQARGPALPLLRVYSIEEFSMRRFCFICGPRDTRVHRTGPAGPCRGAL